MGDHHHDFINSGSWWKLSSSSSSLSSSSTSTSMRPNSNESSVVFHDNLHHHHDHHEHSLATNNHHQHHHNLQMIGLGLSSSQSHDVDQWNHSLLRGGDSKAETSFGLMLQENLNLDANANAMWRDQHQQQQHIDNNNDYKTQNIASSNRGFFLDHTQFSSPHGSSSTDSSTVTCQGFVVDNNLYGTATTQNSSSSGMFHNQQSNLAYSSTPYDHMAATAMPSGLFMRSSPPAQKPHSPLRFSNNATYWNPSAAAGKAGLDASSGFFHPPQIHAPNFHDQPKGMSEIRDLSGSEAKRGGGEQPAAKRTKSEAASPSPAFKVRKEKMGDRIAALQQLVSPFGKTDAASVLSEAIEYIKFLHQQVSALSNPYMKSGASLHHQQIDHEREVEEADLRSRGLCLVPVSSTFPVTHDTSSVDFWTPTFGGTFR
ncbi:unnamed protein product [Cochlearia groenlandica]